MIRRIAASGKTVFVTTHYMDEAEHCGRIAMMRDGKLIALDTPGGLKKSSFPEPLVELEAGPTAAADWADRLRHSRDVFDAKPHGLRWHASAKDAPAIERLRMELSGVAVRAIQPSLEDVFIRLVEGKAQ